MILLLLAGCPLPKGDSGSETGDPRSRDSVDSTETDTVSTTDACTGEEWQICFEFDEYADTRRWCDAIASNYGVTTTYEAEPCALGAVVACSIPAASGTDFDHDAEAYYYAPNWDISGAESACTSAGGTPHAP
jgi:hypothetical protein